MKILEVFEILYLLSAELITTLWLPNFKDLVLNLAMPLELVFTVYDLYLEPVYIFNLILIFLTTCPFLSLTLTLKYLDFLYSFATWSAETFVSTFLTVVLVVVIGLSVEVEVLVEAVELVDWTSFISAISSAAIVPMLIIKVKNKNIPIEKVFNFIVSPHY